MKVLFLSPHTDDVELGCGGTLSKMIRDGREIMVVAFSPARESVPPDFPEDALIEEMKRAMEFLGIGNYKILEYPVRKFPEYRQEILEELVKMREEFSPDLVFVPSSSDVHQDHEVIHKEALRAFRKVSILGYEQPWNTKDFHPQCFILLTQEDVERKIRALSFYHTQKRRKYFDPEFIKSLAKLRGMQADGEYAEAFEVVRWHM